MSYSKDAEDVLSLAYKYPNLLSCMEGQRPLLLNDPIISYHVKMIEMANSIIEERVRVLANDLD